jgi:biotin transport system substrate-specific component
MKKVNSKLMAVDIAEISIFVALMCVFTVYVSIPIDPIYVTFQTVISILSGLLLGWKKGVIAMAVYCFMGLIGIPVFSGGRGGIVFVVMPSFGYIIGFIAASFTAGIICKAKRYPLWRYIIASLAGCLINYLIGIPYAVLIWTYYNNYTVKYVWELVIAQGFMYMPKDIILALVAAIVAWRVVPAIHKGRNKILVKQPVVIEQENKQDNNL